jgi:hypothetical protein
MGKANRRLNDILTGYIFNNDLNPKSALVRLNRTPLPSERVFRTSTLITFPFILGMIMSVIIARTVAALFFINDIYFSPLDDGAISIVIGALISIIWLFTLTTIRASIRQNLFKSLHPSLHELSLIKGKLEESILEFDTRTRSVVHCVTSTKIKNYFVLQQILAALSALIERVESILEEKSFDSYFVARRLLAGALIIRDGVVIGSGEEFHIPLMRLADSLDYIADDLDLGLIDVEGELATARSSYVSSNPL